MAVINVPAPAGSALAGQIQMQAMQGLGQALGSYLGQRRAGQYRQENLRRIQAMGPQQDIFNTMYGARGMQAPQAQAPQMVGPQAQQQQLALELGRIYGDSYGKPPWWVQGATQRQVEDYRGRVGGPLVQIGERLLSPEKRQELAEAEYEKGLTTKPLTPTEKKGVQATITEVMGERRTIPFGIRPGAAYSQEEMNRKWEETIEATGYAGRSKVQQKQIEGEFDRHIAMLNKGKGLGVLKGQYQWNRKKYKIGGITGQTKSIEPQTKGLTEFGAPTTKEQFNRTYQRLKPENKQAYINKHWRPEFGRHLK